ncbi:MAG: LSM domain-containing protein [Halobacteriales archaeon]
MSGRPLDALEAALGETVVVQLKDGETYAGELAGYDQHMNVVLDPPAEVDLESLAVPVAEAAEDTTIIRGDNVVTIRT